MVAVEIRLLFDRIYSAKYNKYEYEEMGGMIEALEMKKLSMKGCRCNTISGSSGNTVIV